MICSPTGRMRDFNLPDGDGAVLVVDHSAAGSLERNSLASDSDSHT